MISPTGIIPESLMYPEKKAEVLDWLYAQPAPGRFKVELLHGWAITVGVRLRREDYNRVERTGTDQS